MTERPRLAADEARLHYVLQNRVDDPALAQACRRLLSPEEESRLARLAFEERRREYLAARAVCRSVLSLYADVRPERWRFIENEHGRPEIVPIEGAPALRFSLTHTRGLIACLVTAGPDAGVDAEDEARTAETAEIAKKFFSSSEARDLESLPAVSRRRRFFEYWTLKEAYVKARGLGLSLPLDRFSFHVEDGRDVRVSFGAEIGDEPRAWQFALFRPSPSHVLAAALRRPGGREMRVSLRENGLAELLAPPRPPRA